MLVEMLDTYGQDDYRPSDYYNNSKPAMYNSGDYRGRSHDSLPTNKQAAHSESYLTTFVVYCEEALTDSSAMHDSVSSQRLNFFRPFHSFLMP
jgi:hypothetical protein